MMIDQAQRLVERRRKMGKKGRAQNTVKRGTFWPYRLYGGWGCRKLEQKSERYAQTFEEEYEVFAIVLMCKDDSTNRE